MRAMTNPERMALLRALAENPEIKRRYPQFWRVKRHEGAALRKLAASVGVDVDALRLQVGRDVAARVPSWGSAAAPAPVLAPSAASATLALDPPYAFRGIFRFPIKIGAFGSTAQRQGRVTWEYTPEWDHFDIAAGRIVRGAVERSSVRTEIGGKPEGEGVTYFPAEPRDGGKGSLAWTAFDFLAPGVLPEEIIDRIYEIIDADARKQDQERREAAGL